MLRVISDGVWAEIKKLGRGTTKFAAIAYVTSDHLKFSRGDVLVCDASDSSVSAGQTSVRVLRKAHARGAKLYSSSGLHAKALVLGRVAIVGSANMSERSASELNEAVLVTDDARAVAGVRVLVDQLAGDGTAIDDAFLARIAKIKVRPSRNGSKRRAVVKLRGPRAWLISVVPLDDKKHKSERTLVASEKERAAKLTEFADSAAGHIRWSGNSLFRKFAKKGDLVVTIERPNQKSQRAAVYPPEPLLHRRDDGRITHFFVEEYADREDTAISFSKFEALWRRVALGAGATPTRKSTREVPSELAESLRQRWRE